jgi:hypothetical protein
MGTMGKSRPEEPYFGLVAAVEKFKRCHHVWMAKLIPVGGASLGPTIHTPVLALAGLQTQMLMNSRSLM